MGQMAFCTLERLIDDALKRSTFKSLEELLEESDEIVPCKCSKQMINKLNKLMQRELSKKEVKNTTLLLNCIHKYGKNMTIQGEDGLTAMIKQGLVQKMVPWFEKARKIWENGGKEKNDALTNFAEDFFDALMAIFNTNREGRCQVLDAFLHRIGSIVTDDHVTIYIQEEAIRKLNAMLNQMSREDRKRILLSSEMQLLMNDFGKRILDAGDYNLQVAVTEGLCRMASETQRQELADHWFYMDFVADAFRRIKDSEFETDCRRFLNHVNLLLGEKTSISTFPCLEVFLGKHELQMPSDAKLEEFWIDFNVGSQSISFYVITEEDDEEPMWETVCLPEEDVESYDVEVKDEKTLLAVDMNVPVRIGNIEGNQIQIYFDLTLDVLNTVRKVYRSTKFKGLPMKDRISEVKTAVHVIFDGTSSQVLVAESQLSSPCNKETGSEKKLHSKAGCLPGTGTNPEQASVYPAKPLVPHKQKTSEVSMVVTCTERLATKSPCTSAVVNSRKSRLKPPLEMKNSSGRSNTFKVRLEEAEPGNSLQQNPPEESATNKLLKERSSKNAANSATNNRKSTTDSKSASSLTARPHQKKIPAKKVVEILQEEDEENRILQKAARDRPDDIVPDSQPVVLKEKPLLPGLLESIHKDQRPLSRKRCWVSDSPASSCSTLERQTSCMKYTFQQDDRIIKHQTFCSIFDGKSPRQDHQNKFQNPKNKSQEQQLTDTLEKVMPTGRHKKSGTNINDTNKRIPHTVDRRISSSSPKEKFSKTERLCQTKYTDNIPSDGSVRRSDVTNCKLDEIGHGTGPKEQNKPKGDNCSMRRNIDLPCKGHPREDEWEHGIKKESTITETMISAIAARYSIETKAKLLNKDVSLLNSTGDVYSFDGSSADEATVTLGAKYKKVHRQTNTSKREPEKENMKNSLTKKEVVPKSSGHRKKKHFFTDTDTDGKTDVSWLRESNKKTKAKLVAYSRKKKQNMAKSFDKEKVAMPHRSHCEKKSKLKKVDVKHSRHYFEEEQENYFTRCPGQYLSLNQQKPIICSLSRCCLWEFAVRKLAASTSLAVKRFETFSGRERRYVNKLAEKINSTKVPAERKLRACPQRTAAVQPCYKEASESEFDSSEECLRSSPQRERDLTMPIPAKKVCENSKREANMPTVCMNPHEISEVSSILSFADTSSVEKIRYERMCEPMVLTRPSSPLEPESSIQSEASPEPLPSPNPTTVVKSSKSMRSFAKTATPLSSLEKATFATDFSPVLSPMSLLPATPLCLESCQMNGKDEDVQQEFVTLNQPDKYTTMNKCRSSESSIVTARSSSNFTIKTISSKETAVEETLSTSAILGMSRRGEMGIVHTSGPSSHASVLNRIYAKGHQSNFHDIEDDEETKEQGAQLRPRKLFQCDVGNRYIDIDTKFLSTINGDHSSATHMDSWELSKPNMGVICQQFSKELKVKFQKHSQRIDTFTKFSLKSVQQRMSSTNLQIHGYRLQRLNKFQTIITQELEHFEKDSQSFKCMEKELTNLWKQHSKAFSELKENEEQRIQHLRSSFENNLCHSVELEERIFSTEMHLMRKDMKTIQDRLLKEMASTQLYVNILCTI
uniref:synaptonemal complex protein 2 n=1 Tax=Pristiophorus japonicus TaxID=55135 RepID=UPI00398E7AB7